MLAAIILNQRRQLAVADVRRALEHHVLEEMRVAGLARLLVPRADIVGHADRDDRCRMVGRNHHPQAVGQLRFRVLHLRHGDGARGDSQRGHNEEGKQNSQACHLVPFAVRSVRLQADLSRSG